MLAFFAGTVVSFFTLPIWVTVAINFAKEGPRTDWLGFYGSLIGAAMTLFAGLVAWLSVQQQIRNTNEQVRAAEALREEERINEATRDIRTLNAARNYLSVLVREFPEPNRIGFNEFNFAGTLLQLYYRARVYVSESASNAPGEFGIRILTETWRIRTLAENVDSRERAGKMSFQDLSDEIRECIIEILRIIDDLNEEIERREILYATLVKQRDRLRK
ncbi:hypothetical protein [Bradyrhizobium sp. Cp5.3]|uniref:hypothetical protein n=1 Tax=Bradyrhizobium sp. Cp5.3 TaxID=443598 RepID=UPI0012EC4C98|nr:hypothetical protein [Bradyrhizobium sp. Cp5.3]